MDGRREYLVLWQGFSREQATWEPEPSIVESLRPLREVSHYQPWVGVGTAEQKQLKEHGLKICCLAKADGTCFFRSLAHLVYGSESLWRTVRREILNWMKDNKKK